MSTDHHFESTLQPLEGRESINNLEWHPEKLTLETNRHLSRIKTETDWMDASKQLFQRPIPDSFRSHANTWNAGTTHTNWYHLIPVAIPIAVPSANGVT
jgi:hypothetical protein